MRIRAMAATVYSAKPGVDSLLLLCNALGSLSTAEFGKMEIKLADVFLLSVLIIDNFVAGLMCVVR